MTEAPGLNVEYGITLKKLTAQLAAAEARMVRTAKRAESGFTRSNRRIERGFNQVTQSTRTLTGSNGLRMVALQLSQVGQQGAVTGDYFRALSIQMPDILLAFGTFGALAGAAGAALTPLIQNLLASEDASDDLVQSLNQTTASLGSIRGAIEELRGLQDSYVDLIRAQGSASNAAASAVVSNTRREFEARRQLVEVERTLLRLRSEDERSSLRALRSQQENAIATLQRDLANLAAPTAAQLSNPDLIGVPGAPRIGETLSLDEIGARTGNQFTVQQIRERNIAIQRLEAELSLTTLAAEEAAAALDGAFEDIGGASGTDGESGSGASRRVREVNDEIANTIGLAQEVGSAVRSGFSNLFQSIVEGGENADQVLQKLAQRLASLVLERSTFDLLARILPGTFGASGFAPLVAGARAAGGPVSAGSLYRVNENTANSEFFVPSRSGAILNVPQAQAAVRGAGGGGTQVNVFETTGAAVRTERTRGADGREIINVTVEDAFARGRFDQAQRGRYGAAPATVRR